MKILVVDDDRAKAKKLVPVLVRDCGLAEGDIAFAYDAAQARTAMANVAYDVLLLDLLLPADGLSDPDLRQSIELLYEIQAEGSLRKPSVIVGVTRDKGALSSAEPLFEESMWQVIEVEDSSDDWVERLVKLVQYQISASQQDRADKFLCDVAVITALSTPEMAAVHRLDWNWEVERPLDRATLIRKGSFTVGERNFSVVSAYASRVGMVSTAIVASKIILTHRPRFLVMTGICAGIEARTKLGDVIFADPCWDYQSGKHAFDEKRGSHFKVAPHQLDVSEAIRPRAEALRLKANVWREIEDGWQGPKPKGLSMHVGPMATGSAVLADERVLPAIEDQRRDLLAVEMEAYGLMAAARGGSTKPTAFVVKSVCDYASSTKNDHYQDYAAYTSANAMRVFFEHYMHEIYPLAGD